MRRGYIADGAGKHVPKLLIGAEMNDEAKSKEQLINELMGLRQRNAELEALEPDRKQADDVLRKSDERFRWVAETTRDIIFRQLRSVTASFISPISLPAA